MHHTALRSLLCGLALAPLVAAQTTRTVTLEIDPQQSHYDCVVGFDLVAGHGQNSPILSQVGQSMSGTLVIEETLTSGTVTAVRLLTSSVVLTPFFGVAIDSTPVVLAPDMVPFSFSGTLALSSNPAGVTLPVAPDGSLAGSVRGTGVGGGVAAGAGASWSLVGRQDDAPATGTTASGDMQIQFDLLYDTGFLGSLFGVIWRGYADMSLTIVASPSPARAMPGRSACAPTPLLPSALAFTPSVGGGYAVSDAAAGFDPAFATGTLIAPAVGSLSSPMPLGFSFPMPGGTSVGAVEIDRNGRILAPGSAGSADFTPTIAEVLASPSAQILPFATGMHPLDGQLWFHSGPGFASVTWDSVPQVGGNTPLTFQCVLRDDGGFEFHYASLGVLGVGNASNLLVGASSGGGAADPGSSDLSMQPTSASPVLYEVFDDATQFDLGVPSLESVELVAVTPPALGTGFQLDVQATGLAASASLAVYRLGFPSGLFAPSLGLGFLGSDLASCELLVDVVTPGALLAVAVGPVGAPTTIVDVPADPILEGVSGLVVQAIAIDPSGPVAFLPTDELVLTFGH